MSGLVRVVDHQAGIERDLASGSPGEFVGELVLLTGERAATAVGEGSIAVRFVSAHLGRRTAISHETVRT
jgi:hypothetical protein